MVGDMSQYSMRKLGYVEPNLAYDLPEVLIRIRKFIRNAELERLETFADHAQLLLDAVKLDVEAHLIILQRDLNMVKTKLNNDNSESGSVQHPEPAAGREVE
jgi:hypothetical protein